MKNKLSDLNNHLFAQMERLAAGDLTAEQLDAEVKRTDAIAAVTKQADREHEDEMAAIAADFRRLTEEARAASGCKVGLGKDGLECTK